MTWAMFYSTANPVLLGNATMHTAQTSAMAVVLGAAVAAAAGAAGLPIFVSVRLQEDWARYGGCLASGESVGQAQ